MARLTSPQGAVVEVRDDKVAGLLRMGFSEEESAPAPKRAPAKKSASSKTEK